MMITQVDIYRVIHFYKLVLEALVSGTTTGLTAQVDDRTVFNVVALTPRTVDQIH